MRFLRAHTEIYSQMASGRPLISNPAIETGFDVLITLYTFNRDRL
jgi:hypothetical protein